jgi:signal transduction histidine kinase
MLNPVGSTSDTARPRILVVEDDEAILQAVVDALHDGGYQVESAAEGRSALTRLRSEPPPDLIVLDLMMPVMDGWEFRTVQRSDPALADVPVLAISADGSAKASAIHAARFLKKPFRPGELVDAVERILADRERRRLYGCLLEAERLAVLGTLAAGAAHEISSPLSVVVMNLGIMETELAQAREQLRLMPRGRLELAAAELLGRLAGTLGGIGEQVHDARTGADRIVGVTRRLQELARRWQEQHQPLDVRRIVETALSVAWPRLRDRARVVKEIDDVPLVRGSPVRLGQMIVNLLTNAAQAIAEGEAACHQVTITVRPHEEGVAIEVADTGEGMTPEVCDRIFEPFFTTRPAGTGMGLGLAISRAVVTEHGGSIEVDSKPGHGSRFRVLLPAVRSAGV